MSEFVGFGIVQTTNKKVNNENWNYDKTQRNYIRYILDEEEQFQFSSLYYG